MAETNPTPPNRLDGLFAAGAALGALLFALGVVVGTPPRAWLAFHVNLLYWTGLAVAGTVIAAVFQMTTSRWGARIRRLGVLSAAFLPVAFLLFLVDVYGRRSFAPPLHDLPHAKQIWLEPTFLALRDMGLLLVLSLLALAFVYYSLRPDLGPAPDGTARPGLAGWIARHWRGQDAEIHRSRRLLGRLAPALAITYALVFSFLAIDQIKALDPTWMSTLFGAYFFITTLFGGWALLAFTAALLQGRPAYQRLVSVDNLHDLGKLLFGFCFLSLDFFWSQFLVIWYGNLPEETPFILKRIRYLPWKDLALIVLIFLFAVPFITLLFKRVKRDRRTMAYLGLLVLVMLWFERFLLVVPSVWTGTTLPLGWIEAGTTLGFLGLFGLAWRWAFRTFPLETALAPLYEPLSPAAADPAQAHPDPEPPAAPADGAREEAAHG